MELFKFHLLLSLLSIISITDAGRRAHCWQIGGGSASYEYVDCPVCNYYQPDDPSHQHSWPVPLDVEVLYTCGNQNKRLTVAECAHQCKCDLGVLSCRSWERCSAQDVTDKCKCRWEYNAQTHGGSCKVDTFNRLYEYGGICFCIDPKIEANWGTMEPIFTVTVK